MKVNKGMTKLQIAWAKQHDWFRAVLNTTEGKVIIAESRVVTAKGEVTGDCISTSNFKELRNWAGY